jgi:hypothetical protein
LRVWREVGLKNLSNGVLIKEVIQKWEVPCWNGENGIRKEEVRDQQVRERVC